MSQLLDVCITLTPPPDGSPPDVIASIALRCDALGLNHKGNLLRDPLTQQERDRLHWYLEEYWKWPYLEFAVRGKQVEALLPQIGKRLYDAVFGHTEASQIMHTWQHYPAQQHQISIISDLPRVLGLPWELLHDGDGFLAVQTPAPVPLVRRLHLPESASESRTFNPPLRILIVTARPRGVGFVDPRRLAHELLDSVQEHIDAGSIELEFLRPPTLSALSARLQEIERPIQVLHFDGHGIFTAQNKQGALAFEDDGGDLHLVNATELAVTLRNSGVQLIVLTACRSAYSSTDATLGSVAAQLLLGGIDAVVAMSATFLVASAARFAEAFYHALTSATILPLAQERARSRLYADSRRHPLQRHSDEEGTAVELQDWWVPHFYQQRPLLLLSTHVQRTREPIPYTIPGQALNQDMPGRPHYGFVGRARELLRMERLLLRRKLIVISGFGGIGKTALAREAAEWFTRTGMYARACFVSFEHGGDATWLLSTLGHFLGIYDGFYHPDDTQAVLARLRPVLEQQPALVIADNLESILPGGESPLDAATRAHLWDVLLELAKLGAGVLLTSRDIAFEDKRLTRSRKVASLALKGLHPEDAYALASHMLDTLGIDRTRAPYPELRDLLARLDHHPLAIQLVLPALRDNRLAEITADFVKLLPTFVDDQEMGRNRSLLASLEYSLRRLSDEQRIFLSRLAVFEGGASEDDLQAVTEIPAEVWATLRPALEQTALITAEQVHKDVRIPFLHFHPILAPYLRNQQGGREVTLLQRYARRYHALADLLSRQDAHHPEAVRALARHELPNLRYTLELLLQGEEVEAASDMAESVAKFLTNFGLMRERDRIRQLVADAMYASGSDQHGLAYAEYLHESGLAEDEWSKGNLQAAVARLTKLLARIEAQPAGERAGRGSYSHCVTLQALARCLEDDQRFVEAERQYRTALSIIEELLKQNPEEQDYLAQHALLLCDIGDVLSQQGHYSQAKENYETALKTYTAINHLRGQSVVLTQIGYLAFLQQNYLEARLYYHEALEHFSTLDEPANEAIGWYQLGMIAREQKEWAEAERCYRESLAREEQLGNLAGIAVTCNQLAVIAENAGRPAEAEGWYRRALELYEQVEPESIAQARVLNNLADLLVNEARAGRAQETRLAEARDYAERSLRIKERPGVSAEVWKTFETLARIAELEGQPEMAQAYRRLDRESFAAFVGNRYQIDQQFTLLIAVIVSATKGDDEARAESEAVWPELEQRGWHITDAVQRIWAGERDWHALVENADRGSALVVLRVLETLAQQPETGPSAEKRGIEGATDDKVEGTDGSKVVRM